MVGLKMFLKLFDENGAFANRLETFRATLCILLKRLNFKRHKSHMCENSVFSQLGVLEHRTMA